MLKDSRWKNYDNDVFCDLIFFFLKKKPDVSYLFTITFQFIGPCYVDVTGPIFTPPISVIHSNGHLLAFWSKDAFQDLEDPFSLNFEYALGEKKD